MKKYSIPCTEEQAKKALELGAPIIKIDTRDKRLIYGSSMCYPVIADYHYAIPTAEQMVCWLEEQGFYFRLDTSGCSVEIDFNCIIEKINIPRKEATLTAIDAALDYLSNNKKYK